MFHQLLHEQLKDHLSETHLLDPSIQRLMQTINDSYTNYEKLQALHEELLDGYASAHLKFLTRLKASPGLNTKTITRLTAAIKEEKFRKEQARETFDYIADLFQNEVEQRKIAEKKLSGAREIIKNASQIQLQFLLMAGEHFGDPLNAVLNFAEKISEDPLTEKQQKALKQIKYTSDSLLFEIKDIIEYNNINNGDIKLNHEPFDINELVHEVCLRYEDLCAVKQNTLDINVYPGLPALIIGDRLKLSRVLHNIVSNAVIYTQEGKIIIDVIPKLCTDQEIILQFKITDTGIGIEPAKQAHLFDELFIHKKAGKGLGLIITNKLLNMMGTNIQIKSTPGKGSVFHFELKLPCIQTLHDTQDSQHFCMNDLRVLLADEDPMHMNFILHFLKQWNISFDIASNGVEAAGLARQNYYDVVFVDSLLTGLDGYTTSSIIKTIHPSSFIVLFSSEELADKEKVISSGINTCYKKPLNSVSLFQLLYKIKKMKPLNNSGSLAG